MKYFLFLLALDASASTGSKIIFQWDAVAAAITNYALIDTATGQITRTTATSATVIVDGGISHDFVVVTEDSLGNQSLPSNKVHVPRTPLPPVLSETPSTIKPPAAVKGPASTKTK